MMRASETAYCSCRRKPLVPSIGSRVQNRGAYFFSQPRSIQSQACSPVASTPMAQLLEHAIEEQAVFLAAEGPRFFLADDRVVRKRVADQPTDGRLAGEIGDGDGAAILFFKDVGGDF